MAEYGAGSATGVKEWIIIEARRYGRGKMLSFAQDVDFFLRRAEQNEQNDLHWEALQLYRKALEVEPDNLAARQGLADTYSNLGCNYTALHSYLNILWNCPTLPGDYEYRMAHKFIAVEEYALGMRCFQRFIQDPRSADYVAERTLAEKLINLWDESQEGEIAAEEVEDLAAWMLTQSGLNKIREGDSEGGIEAIQQARQLAPENMEIAMALATSLWPLKRYGEARDICQEVIEMEDDNIRAHCLLALIAEEMDDHATSKQEMLILRGLAYYSPQEVFQAGMSLADLGDYEHALALFRAGYQQVPTSLWLAHAYAACSMIMGHDTVALDVYMRLRRLMPEDPTVAFFEEKCHRWQDKGADQKTLCREFPLFFTLPNQDGEKLREQIRILSNPFVVSAWEQDGLHPDALPMLLRWGLEKEDGDSQRLALALALRLEKEEAVNILRSYLALPEKWAKAKRAACDILFCLGAEGPYHSWLENGPGLLHSDFAPAYRAAMESNDLPFRGMELEGRLTKKELRVTVYLWEQYRHMSREMPGEEEYLCFASAFRMLGQNLCSRESGSFTALTSGCEAALAEIQRVLEPHYSPVLVEKEPARGAL